MNKIRKLFQERSTTSERDWNVIKYPLMADLYWKGGPPPSSYELECQLLKKYTVKLELGYQFICDPKEFDFMHKRTLDEMSEEVYGDMRKMVVEAIRHCYARDFEKTKASLLALDKYINE